ncbi:MAG: hypothetical protein ACRD0J_16010, partial [Acidimicrobiales bacterium]
MVAGEGEGFDGDPGDAGDEGAGAGDAEEKALRPLPDPDDRLWRHPSEATPGEIPGPVVGPVLPGPGRRRGRGWPDEAGRHRWRSGGHLVGVALVAGAVGALLTT